MSKEVIELLEKAFDKSVEIEIQEYIDQALAILQEQTGTCMCMDCGKVIKVTEQSKHLKECPKKKPDRQEPKPVLPPATGKRQQGHSQLKYDPKLKTLVSVDPHPDCTAQEKPPHPCNYVNFDRVAQEQPPASDFRVIVSNRLPVFLPDTYEGMKSLCAKLTDTINEACAIIDRSAASRKELLGLCEEFMVIADDGSAKFDDPEPGSIYLRAEEAIKANKQGD